MENDIFDTMLDRNIKEVAEHYKEWTNEILEYRKLEFGTALERKRELIKFLGLKVLIYKNKFKNSTYFALIENVEFNLNNLNIIYDNKTGEHRNEIFCILTDEQVEKLYDKTFETIVNILLVNKNN